MGEFWSWLAKPKKIRFRQSGERVYRQKYESTYTPSAFRVYLYDFDVYIQLGNNERH